MVRRGLGEDWQGQKLKKMMGKRICENERSRNSVFRVNMFLFNCFMAIAKSIAMFPDSSKICFLKFGGQTGAFSGSFLFLLGPAPVPRRSHLISRFPDQRLTR